MREYVGSGFFPRLNTATQIVNGDAEMQRDQVGRVHFAPLSSSYQMRKAAPTMIFIGIPVFTSCDALVNSGTIIAVSAFRLS